MSTQTINPFCSPITFNNPIKACFSNKKYTVVIQTRPTQIMNIIIINGNLVLKVISMQNLLPIRFYKKLHVTNLKPPTHTKF